MKYYTTDLTTVVDPHAEPDCRGRMEYDVLYTLSEALTCSHCGTQATEVIKIHQSNQPEGHLLVKCRDHQ